MLLEDYFDFLTPEDIRIKGTRVGIETVLYDHIHRGWTAERIAEEYPVLSLEQVYATILYYHHNHAAVFAYLAAWLEYGHQARAAQARDPVFQAQRERLRKARAARDQAMHAEVSRT